jgi:hypothetical protein
MQPRVGRESRTETSVADPPRFDALPPSSLDKLKSIIGVVVDPTYVEGQSE